MFTLRRAAVRALSQPSRQLCTASSTSRSFILAQSRPAFQRSFHQSIRWFSEPNTSTEVDEAKSGDALTGITDSPNVPKSTKIIFVGNLFFSATASDLETEFARYGTVVNTRLVTDPNGQSKGFGFVEFAQASEAQEAVQNADSKTFQGRRMTVQMHTPRERKTFGSRDNARDGTPAPPSKTLFVGNMSFRMSDRDLNDLFRDVQNVIDVRVAVDRKTGQPRGFAHADFTDIESAEKAKAALKDKVVYGRPLRVDFTRNSTPYGASPERATPTASE